MESKKAIITTPTDLNFSLLIPKVGDINELPVIKTLNTKGKHLFIEYDENNDNLLKQVVDLDMLGLSHIKTVDEYEKITYKLFKK